MNKTRHVWPVIFSNCCCYPNRLDFIGRLFGPAELFAGNDPGAVVVFAGCLYVTYRSTVESLSYKHSGIQHYTLLGTASAAIERDLKK